MSEIETVLIVGGGIAGLTLGRALHREGLTVELIERSTEWRAEGGGIAASPTACAYCAPLASMAQWSGPGNVCGGGASATRQATSFRRMISKRCGAMSDRLSGSSGRACSRSWSPASRAFAAA